jgi:sec-independent protein translocase protein TatA
MLAELFGEGGIIAIVIVAVLLFGGAAIPKLARSLGSAKTNFEKGLEEGKNEASATEDTKAAAPEKSAGS